MISWRSVEEAIGSEVAYLEEKWGGVEQKPQAIPGWLMLMEKYVGRAKEAWAAPPGVDGDRAALEEVRKLAALTMQCMRQHGAPRRKESNE